MKLEKIISEYESICSRIVFEFANKQGIQFDWWVGDDIGTVASFIDQYFFSINEMVYDLKTNQPKGLILMWFDEVVIKEVNNETHNPINYYSYSIGLRMSDI